MKRLMLVSIVACGGVKPARTIAIARNAELTSPGEVGVVELGDAAFAFDHGQVIITRGGAVAGHAEAPARASWDAAATMMAPDGNGRWVVGIAGGAAWRITPTGGLEAIDDRIGVAGAKVLSIDSSGTTSAIGLVGGAVVSNDGTHVMKLTGRDSTHVAAARGRVAIASVDSIDVLDLAQHTQVSYPLEHVWYLAFLDATTDHARLIAAVGRTVYVEDHGKLHKASTPGIRKLAVSGSRLWILADAGLFALDHDVLIGAVEAPPEPAQIFGSRSGGVWISPAQPGHVARYAPEETTDDPAWNKLVAPVFQRVCSKCHLPGGNADTDLSTRASWTFERAEIVQRVLVAHTMPPAGTDLPEADRRALEQWLRP